MRFILTMFTKFYLRVEKQTHFCRLTGFYVTNVRVLFFFLSMTRNIFVRFSSNLDSARNSRWKTFASSITSVSQTWIQTIRWSAAYNTITDNAFIAICPHVFWCQLSYTFNRLCTVCFFRNSQALDDFVLYVRL